MGGRITRRYVRRTRTGTERALWLTIALVFLLTAALLLWLLVRTYASGGARASDLTNEPGGQGGEEAAGLPSVLPDPGADIALIPTDGAVSAESEDTREAETDPAARNDDDLVYYRHRNDRMDIALSFDDGPHPSYTPEILSILDEYGVTATFFMVGENVQYWPEVAESVIAAGHEVGNHSYDHARLSSLTETGVREQISRCEEAIASVGEYRPHLLRPPEGCLSQTVRKLSRELDYRIILWDIDTRDWAHTPPGKIAQNILDNVQAGDIILMHDYIGHDSPTPEALRLVLPELLARGYRFVTVSELIDGN